MSNLPTRPKSYKNGVEILVRGIVQGVGFRPFVFKLASRFKISGTVTNTSSGVIIQAHSAADDLGSFIEALSAEAPPLARIIDLQYTALESPLRAESFSIIASQVSENVQAIIPPDIAICDDCQKELIDSEDHRFHYPFTNCTNCGPRFTIVEAIPYDRPKTSMKIFPMCASCAEEYKAPENRRFHAQPNACPDCGPSISWHDSQGILLPCDDVIKTAVSALGDNKIVAIRGLGGFHLCTNGCSENGVQALRARKQRVAKPLAIMVKDIESVYRLCHLSDSEAQSLFSPEHPILLLKLRDETELAKNIAPQMSDIGIMLPYTPLHHLMFQEPDCPTALVMTSGNVSGEPICTSNEDALDRLATIADYFLLHNREIVTRIDDSVVKEIAGAPRLFRRARGYVPSPLLLHYELPEIIGCGGGLKSTFSLARGKTLFPSQHIGDLFNLTSYDFYLESIENLKRLLAIEPIAAACDLHPDYMSSRYAKELGIPLYEVQHHHAHAVAVMAEHGLVEPVLAVILDGTGYGLDTTIWGGEILQADLTSFTRCGSLETMQLPGGDAASSEPWRMALAILYQIFGPKAADSGLLECIDKVQRTTIVQMLESNFNSPKTTSCGRLFDAVAALLGLNYFSSFEGQAAMQLESCARKCLPDNWKNELAEALIDEFAQLHRKKDQRMEIISSEFVKKVVLDLASGKDQSEIALQFHYWLISCISRLVENISESTGIHSVVLSGGCMQNGLLMEGLLFTLTELGFEVYTGSQIPINDGGISIGQAVIGGLQHVSRSTDES